jgi:hypothetical protein
MATSACVQYEICLFIIIVTDLAENDDRAIKMRPKKLLVPIPGSATEYRMACLLHQAFHSRFDHYGSHLPQIKAPYTLKRVHTTPTFHIVEEIEA